MQWRNDSATYGIPARFFHWTVFALFVGLCVSGLVMETLPRGPDKWALYGMHKSLGLTTFGLVVLRLAWRLYSPAPQVEHGRAVWLAPLAGTAHVLLYLLLLAIPLSGYVMSIAGGHDFAWFGLVPVPALVGENEQLAQAAGAIHALTAWGTALVAAGHAGAALWHHFVAGDRTLRRMLAG